jgi:hypothetical protein
MCWRWILIRQVNVESTQFTSNIFFHRYTLDCSCKVIKRNYTFVLPFFVSPFQFSYDHTSPPRSLARSLACCLPEFKWTRNYSVIIIFSLLTSSSFTIFFTDCVIYIHIINRQLKGNAKHFSFLCKLSG